jgi:Ni,Fe-hydrogenase III small subunit
MAFAGELKPPRIQAERNVPPVSRPACLKGAKSSVPQERRSWSAARPEHLVKPMAMCRWIIAVVFIAIGVEHPLDWQQTYEWAALRDSQSEFGPPFKRSIHIIVVDAGDCGACLNEVKQLNNPYYNMHRLGFFITPTPRHADVMLVVGPVTDHMRFVLDKIYDAMPTPKRIVAVGACAVSGGVFAESFVCAKGVASVLPVDVEVPGQPPPPLAILHGLLAAVGRKNSAPLVSPPPAIEANSVK